METTRRHLASLGRGLLESSFLTQRPVSITVYAWADVDGAELDFRILPLALPALPFHFSAMDTPSDTCAQGPLFSVHRVVSCLRVLVMMCLHVRP